MNQIEAIQIKKGLYLTGIVALIIIFAFCYQWFTGMELDTGEKLSVPIVIGAFLSMVRKHRKLACH